MLKTTDIAVDEHGNALETVIAEPHWIYAWWTTSPEGDRWLSVYRSLHIMPGSEQYPAELTELVAGMELLRSEEGYDDHMMGRHVVELFAA